MPWWAWILLGLVLLGLELLLGTLYLIFPGVAALAIGLLAFVDAGSAWVEWLLFTVLSLGTMMMFRRPLLGRLKIGGDSGDLDALIGETAVLAEPLPPGGIGKAAMRGSSWNVRNAGAEPLAAGQRVRVERVQGLLLWVTADTR
ncbi:MAG TPA: NfeD family protein [Thermoanaerobaculia bacterium]|nr:NfeD family protein [Thermoanaerobaculia bacterium]